MDDAEPFAPMVTKAEIWQIFADWQMRRASICSCVRPDCVTVHEMPWGTAVLVDGSEYLGSMNRIYSRSAEPSRLSKLLALYAGWSHQPEIWFAFNVHMNEAKARRLGLKAADRYDVVAGRTECISKDPIEPEGLHVRRVQLDETSEETRRLFDIYLEAFGSAPEYHENGLTYMSAATRIEDVYAFAGRANAEDVTVGLLWRRGRLGFLCGGATSPAFRKRGGQSAMIRARIDLARELEVSVVCSHAIEGSLSSRNLQSSGLQPVGTMQTWHPTTD